jgi:hypothetical protein
MGGCAEDVPGPLVTSYPLQEGWSWDYRRAVEGELLNGSSDRVQQLDSARVEAVGSVTWDGQAAYSVISTVLSDGPPLLGQDYFRQTSRDLHHVVRLTGGGDLDVLPKPGAGAPDPSWAAASGPGPAQDPGGRTVLAYPLIPGNSWVMQVTPSLITRSVVAEERITVPAGRFETVRIETTIHGPEPLTYTDWIGQIGLVRRELVWELDEYFFVGHPARERVHARIDLRRYTRP